MQCSRSCAIDILLTYTSRSNEEHTTSLGRIMENPFNSNRHECNSCDFMPTSAGCICCKEIARIVAKIGEANDTAVTCITGHPGLRECVSMYGFYKLHPFSTGRNMEVHLHHHHYKIMLVTTAHTLFALLYLSLAECTDTALIGS